MFSLRALCLKLVHLDVVDRGSCLRRLILKLYRVLHLVEGVTEEFLCQHRLQIPNLDVFVNLDELSCQLLPLCLSLGNLDLVLLALLLVAHIDQLYGLVLDPDPHQFVLDLYQFSLSIHFLLREIVLDKSIDLLVEVLDLDILTLDHIVEVGELQDKLVVGFWVRQMLRHLALQLVELCL